MRGSSLVLAIVLFSAAACASRLETPEQATTQSLTLKRGDSGPAVRQVFDYLFRYGYFPNAELKEQFANWHPAVTELPARPDVFDAPLEEAVMAFQELGGLPVTGVVDPATREFMQDSRCGVPDTFESPEDKWALLTGRWNTNSLTWRYVAGNEPSGINAATTRQNIANAIAVWTARSGFTATEITTGTPKVTISWPSSLGSAALVNHQPSETATFTGATLQLNRASNWGFTNSPASNQIHFFSTLVHEFGHVFGLLHSSRAKNPMAPVMAPVRQLGTTRPNLTDDDIQAIHALEPGYSPVTAPASGGATNGLNIVAGGDGSVWTLTGPFDNNGLHIFKRNSLDSGWTEPFPSARAIMVAVQRDGTMWHINSLGDIWQQVGSGFVLRDGSAQYIAAAGDEVWHLSRGIARGNLDRTAWRWLKDEQRWVQVPTVLAADLALNLDPTANSTNPRLEAWHTNESRQVFRQVFSSGAWSSPTSMGVPQVPGGACGISAGADGVVYALGCPLNNNLAGAIFEYNFQVRDTGSDPNDELNAAPALNQWTQVPGEARDVTSTPNSTIWHIGNTSIFRSR